MRGILDEWDNGTGPDVEVTVRIEHTTPRAIQVSQDGGESVVWIPRESILGSSRKNYGPGDTLRITIPERLAEEKGLDP